MSPTTAASRPEASERSARRLTLIATSLGFAVIQLDVSVVNVAIKPIGEALGSGVSGLQWVVNAYTVAFAALILSAGALADRIGARRMFVGGFALFTLASAGCGLASSLPLLIAARAVQGTGAAILAPSSLTLLGHTFTEPGERTRAVGFWAAGGSIALAGGPLIGGILTSALSWRAIFFINAPFGLAGILLTLRYAVETAQDHDRALDLPGQLSAIVCLITLAAATIQGGHSGFDRVPVLAGYGLALIAAAVFVTVERRRARPMLPPSLLRSAAFSAAAAVGILINVAFYGLIFVLSLFFQRAQHHGALVTGLAFVPSTIAVLASNLLAGRLDARYGPRRVVAAGAVSMPAGAVALLGMHGTSPYGALVAQLIALGFGIGLIVPAITAAILGSTDRGRAGIAAGALNTARQTGSVIGVALFGALIGGGDRITSGLHTALAISALLALLVAVLSRRLPGTPTA